VQDPAAIHALCEFIATYGRRGYAR
jgi:hypothetical protein